jgi:thiol:disulfide interchange protein DsbA
MTLRNALIPLCLSFLLAACGAQDTATPDAAPAPAAEPAPAEVIADEPALDPDAPAPEAPAADAAAPAQEGAADGSGAMAGVPAAASATAVPGLVEGRDYQIIRNGQPFEATPGKIEVAEVFAYWCGTCAQFDPIVEAWKAKLPADVNFVYVPAVFNPQDNYPRAFYAAQALGIAQKSHSPTFRALHMERKIAPNASVEDLAKYYAGFGVDSQAFLSTMQSFAVNANLSRARQFATRSQVTGTPAIVVNGRYHVALRGSLENMLRATEAVIAHERANAR